MSPERGRQDPEDDPRRRPLADANERARRVVPIQDVLSTFLSRRGIGRPPLQRKVFDAWRDAAGEALARRAVPVRFRRDELLVEVASATHYQELVNFTGEPLRRRANEILGAERIRRVIFKRKS